jgi:hypothetical protein
VGSTSQDDVFLSRSAEAMYGEVAQDFFNSPDAKTTLTFQELERALTVEIPTRGKDPTIRLAGSFSHLYRLKLSYLRITYGVDYDGKIHVHSIASFANRDGPSAYHVWVEMVMSGQHKNLESLGCSEHGYPLSTPNIH